MDVTKFASGIDGATFNDAGVLVAIRGHAKARDFKVRTITLCRWCGSSAEPTVCMDDGKFDGVICPDCGCENPHNF